MFLTHFLVFLLLSSLDLQISPDLNPEARINRHSQSSTRDSNISEDRQIAEPQYKPGFSTKVNEALQRVGSVHRTGRSASAEDLLERLESKYSPQHVRSRSSPTADKLNQVILNRLDQGGSWSQKTDRPLCVSELNFRGNQEFRRLLL